MNRGGIFCLVIVWIVCHLSANAQGKAKLWVKDQERLSALPGALVYCNDKAVGITNTEGIWIKESAGVTSDAYRLKMLGFIDTLFYWDAKSDLTIQMRPRDLESSTLTISATMYGRPLQENTQSIESIDGRDIIRKRNVDAAAILERVPGVTIIDGQASFRGGSGYSYGAGSRVMLVIDDMPLLTVDRNDIKWNYVPTEMIDKMEVVKGASSVQYGSSALNGVVHVRTMAPREKPHLLFQTYQTSYSKPSVEGSQWWNQDDQSGPRQGGMIFADQKDNPYQAGYLIRYGQRTGRVLWILGGSLHQSRGWIKREKENRMRWTLKTIYLIPKHPRLRVGLNAQVMRQNQSSVLFWANDTTGAFVPNGDGVVVNYNDLWMNADPWLSYHDKKGNHHQLKSRFYASYFPNNRGFRSGLQLRHATYSFQHRTAFGLDWVSGVNANYFAFGDDAYAGRHVGNFVGCFTQGDWSWRRWHFSGGARIESFSVDTIKVKAIPVGRLGATFSINEHHILRASYVQGYRFPSPAERYVNYSIDQINIYANPDVAPEHGWNVDLGYKGIYEKKQFQATWDAVLFLTRYRDLIEFTFGKWGPPTDPVFGLGYKSVNVSNAQVGGMEVSGNANGKLNGWEMHALMGYTYLLPVDLDLYHGGRNVVKYAGDLVTEFGNMDSANYLLRYRFKHMIKMNADIQKGHWGFGFGYRYYSFMQKIDPVLEWFVDGLAHYRSTQTTGTHIWDARLFYQISDKCSASVQVQNVFNAFYATRPAKPDAPRNFSLQLTWRID